MIAVNCYDLQGERLVSYTQWDMNQEIVFEGQFNSPPIVHFCNKTMDSAYTVLSKTYNSEQDKYIVSVPNGLFLVPYNIFMYFFIEDLDSGKTMYFKNIPVRPKTKPDDFEFKENVHVVSLTKLEKELRELITSVTESEEVRSSNENTRINNEKNREQNEKNRQAFETTRQDNEVIRQNTLAQSQQAISDAESATNKALDAANKANISSQNTDQAIANANAATVKANDATTKAEQAASSANNAANSVGSAIEKAETATNAANAASSSANASASKAETATSSADIATQNANKAATNANEAAEKALAVAGTDMSNKTISFQTANTRSQLQSGSSLSTLLGQINKWFTDLKSVAFSGSYSDLINTPKIINNLTTTTTGGVLDASQGTKLNNLYTELSGIVTDEILEDEIKALFNSQEGIQ